MSRPLACLALVLVLRAQTCAQEELPLPLPPTLPETVVAPPSAPAPVTATVASRQSASSSSVSTSGQFVVHGSELRVRGGLAARCEEISQELSRLLRTTEPWVWNVVVQIKSLGPADPPDLGINGQLGVLDHGGFHLQLNVPERAGLRPADFRRELLRLLLAERVLRGHKDLAEGRGQIVPAWVHTGVLKALDFKSRARPSAEFSAIFKSGRVYGIEEILDTTPAGLDALSRAIYETSCCALVLALLDQPEGPMRFGRFLSALAGDAKPERELLKQWFPGLAESDTSLNKWWSLQLAQLASPGLSETLDPVASAELLDRALTFQLPAAGKEMPKPRAVKAIAAQRPEPASETVAPQPVPAALAAASTAKKAGPAKPAVKSVSSRPREVPAAPTSETGPAGAEQEPQPGLLRRVFPFNLLSGGKEADAEEKPESGAAPEKTAPAPAEEKQKAPVTAEEPPPPAKPEKPAKPAPEPAKETKPKNDPPVEKPAEGEERGGGRFNPLKWFRGGKKEEAAPADPEDIKAEKKTSARGTAASRRDLVVRDLLGNARGRFIQAPLAPAEKADLLELPPVLAPPAAAAPVTEVPAVAYAIEDYAVILAHPEKDRLLNSARLALKDLMVRGNVLFRETAKDYLLVIEDLTAGRIKGMDARLTELRRKAVATLAKACAVQDHLDWYEAARQERPSDLFEDYLSLPARLEEELPPRSDPLSRLLDEAEARHGR